MQQHGPSPAIYMYVCASFDVSQLYSSPSSPATRQRTTSVTSTPTARRRRTTTAQRLRRTSPFSAMTSAATADLVDQINDGSLHRCRGRHRNDCRGHGGYDDGLAAYCAPPAYQPFLPLFTGRANELSLVTVLQLSLFLSLTCHCCVHAYMHVLCVRVCVCMCVCVCVCVVVWANAPV
eukprot:GHVU01060064.1.p1 GENE.GHVU01060064.1~~GHVU01060064.1.p1  ORF type:complete len:178 (-),score=8.12 GHVU01060064.1:274-807(-)